MNGHLLQIRLSSPDLSLIADLAQTLGWSRSAVVRAALGRWAAEPEPRPGDAHARALGPGSTRTTYRVPRELVDQVDRLRGLSVSRTSALRWGLFLMASDQGATSGPA